MIGSAHRSTESYFDRVMDSYVAMIDVADRGGRNALATSYAVVSSLAAAQIDVLQASARLATSWWVNDTQPAVRRAASRSGQLTRTALAPASSPPATSPLTAFNLRTKRRAEILQPEVVTLKDGRRAVRGLAADDGITRVFRIISPGEAKLLEGP